MCIRGYDLHLIHGKSMRYFRRLRNNLLLIPLLILNAMSVRACESIRRGSAAAYEHAYWLFNSPATHSEGDGIFIITRWRDDKMGVRICYLVRGILMFIINDVTKTRART